MNKLKLMAILMIAMPCMMQASNSEGEEKNSDVSEISTSGKEKNSKRAAECFIDFEDEPERDELIKAQQNRFIDNALKFTEAAHAITNHLIRSKRKERGSYYNTCCSRLWSYVCCKKSREQEKQERKECKATLQTEAEFLLQQAEKTTHILEAMERIEWTRNT